MFVREQFQKSVFYWLMACVVLVAFMVSVGGYTRLTGSGLSITEWEPIHGAVPPLSAVEWKEEFDKYREIPQYQLINKGMSMEEFKAIYWPEFWHRNLGRLIGFVFFIPFVYFVARRAFSKQFGLCLLGIFALGGLQGAVGWVMVASGLEDRTHVSHIKLAMHLCNAFVIFGLLVYAALKVRHCEQSEAIHGGSPRDNVARDDAKTRCFAAIIALLFLQIALGALMAGLHAGLLYPTYPLMGEHILPPETFEFQGSWIDNPTWIQFLHRTTAIFLTLAYGLWWWLNRKYVKASPYKLWFYALMVVLAAQFALGVLTLINAVALPLALKHQQLGLILFGLNIVWYHKLKSPLKISKQIYA